MTTAADLDAAGARARVASLTLGQTADRVRTAALQHAADALDGARGAVLDANRAEVERSRDAGTSATLVDRLTLTPARLDAMCHALRTIGQLPDPLGEVIDGWRRPNGLEIRRTRVPLGVVAVIYEARPNVTTDVAGLCLRSGNACLLRGSASALGTNRAIVNALQQALRASGLPPGSLHLVEDVGREGAAQLMQLREYVDLLVPRGGPALIAQLRETATVPYVIDGDGNCHVYVDARADIARAVRIVVNAKTSRPSVCNAAEKLLVHREIAPVFLPAVEAELLRHGVEIRADTASRVFLTDARDASDDDWDTEYLDLVLAIRCVDSLEDAITHVQRHSSGHTEAIVTDDLGAARRFVAACPAAVVMVNASTRFTDGGEFGFGAEIGNSTQRLHARGPMGLRELTTYRYEVWGDGQIRE